MKKKILFIINLPPPVYGANVVGDFIKKSELINNAFDCTYVNLTTEKDFTNIGKFNFNKLVSCVRLYFKIFFLLIKKRWDLYYMTINASGAAFYKDFIIVIILKLFRCKVVYHYHNKGVSKGENKWWLNLMYRFQFKNAEAILLSSLLYEDVAKYLPKDRAHICPNGIPEIQGIDLSVINLNRNKKTVTEILYLSNMMIEKGVFVLLEACKILATESIDFKMIFIGGWIDITLEQFDEFVNANNLGKYVAYEGKKYGKDKSAYFERADIFVFPTYYHNETFGLVNLEAMQYGLPIVSTKEGGIPDVVLDNITGFLVEKKNPVELAKKIKILIEHPDIRKNMGLAAKDKFEASFKLDVFENNFINILNRISKN